MRLDTHWRCSLTYLLPRCRRGADWREIAVRAKCVSTMNKEKCSLIPHEKTNLQHQLSPVVIPDRLIYTFVFDLPYLHAHLYMYFLFSEYYSFQVAGYLSVLDGVGSSTCLKRPLSGTAYFQICRPTPQIALVQHHHFFQNR